MKTPKRAPRPGEGRPKKQLKDIGLPENWKDIILEESAKGCSDVEIRAHLCMLGGKFSHHTWDTLKDRDAEFTDTLKKGKILCQAWWEKQSRQSLDHSKNTVFETGSWFANMKNRFGWKDKSEIGLADETAEALAKYQSFSVADLVLKVSELTGKKK